MADVMIVFLYFPNDPCHNGVAHQMSVAGQSDSFLNLYSISSILGKEKRVFGEKRGRYALILPPEQKRNGFKVPSFIDCTKMYRISLDSTVHLDALSQRMLTAELKCRIEAKISEMKQTGQHMEYRIGREDFKLWNPRITA